MPPKHITKAKAPVVVIKPSQKAKIPVALREQVWISKMGKVFEAKCYTTWCQNKISVFEFECGHNIPESKGGSTNLENLVPICPRCNKSMGSSHTFTEWCAKYSPPPPPPQQKLSWFMKLTTCSWSL